ncbi:MAG: rhodanese-like domain-containing protein [Melioribacteraceae bacterium]|nr:rhodanese-like domain-containing protein [Melioribacteraceae bacterium]MCF8352875.1 rhodanese-like domain-containing protein [Melioribacteraceae bacterium]MCF8393808.1 rhodanese-like domain-containing protein [Melioribacteraceae bacterium]MCF8417392.1 rhodanese-like domain-containing protein [Melioribacteraceae bacterium]
MDFIRIEKVYETLSADSLNQFVTKDEQTIAENAKVKLIDIELAFKLYESNEALFIDARDENEFEFFHIKGAVSIPEYSFEGQDDILNKLDKSKLYVVYCDGADCGTSIRLAEKLINYKFDRLLVFEGGIDEWESAGYPIEFGDNQ